MNMKLPINKSAINLQKVFKTGTTLFILIAAALLFPSYVLRFSKNDKTKLQPTINLKAKVLASGLQAPTAMAFPGDNEIWVAEQAGKIRVIKDGKLFDAPLLDLYKKLVKLNKGYEERGLLGITLHPKFKNNKKFYVYYSTPSTQKSNHTGVLAEYELRENGLQVNADKGRTILTIEEPDGNHNGGCIQFGPDGYLYISFGDGGGQGDEHGTIGNGQDLNTWHGKILRIDVNSTTGYKVPKDNPFIDRKNVKPEIWAYGFRNPWRFSFDKLSGELFVGDVGQSTWEEVDIVKRGANYGWRTMEGTHCYKPANGCDIKGLSLPIAEYNHNEGVSVTGGYVYNGNQIQVLKRKYLFADWTGRIYYLQKLGAKWDRGKVIMPDLKENSKITGFGEDGAGELYMLTNQDTGPENNEGMLYKVIR
jgi:glucose/arabinose dehydrogenase